MNTQTTKTITAILVNRCVNWKFALLLSAVARHDFYGYWDGSTSASKWLALLRFVYVLLRDIVWNCVRVWLESEIPISSLNKYSFYYYSINCCENVCHGTRIVSVYRKEHFADELFHKNTTSPHLIYRVQLRVLKFFTLISFIMEQSIFFFNHSFCRWFNKSTFFCKMFLTRSIHLSPVDILCPSNVFS